MPSELQQGNLVQAYILARYWLDLLFDGPLNYKLTCPVPGDLPLEFPMAMASLHMFTYESGSGSPHMSAPTIHLDFCNTEHECLVTYAQAVMTWLQQSLHRRTELSSGHHLC